MDEELTPASIDYRRIFELAAEFTALWKRLQSFYLDASVGFSFVKQRVEREQAESRRLLAGTELDSQEFQDTTSFDYDQIFEREFVTSSIHRATKGDVRRRNSADGDNFNTLGQLCLTAFYDYWNDYLRREYVVAIGRLARDEPNQDVARDALRRYGSHDLWGDLRILRQCVVHNRGVATSDVQRCKVIRWFSPGDEVVLTPVRMRALFVELLKYRNELDAQQYAPSTIAIPRR